MKISRRFDLQTLVENLLGKNKIDGVSCLRTSQIRALSQCITIVENDPHLAPKILQHPLLLQAKNTAHVIGMTGLPGAGKSTLTDELVKNIREHDKSLAVLAVDPSSLRTGGALLGDRVRMQRHFADDKVYIRSMGSRGTLGGIARATRTAIRLLGIIGFEFIIVETVGVGQSEAEITQVADTTVLTLMPQSGDEIQLMKAGVLELADIYVVNKADIFDPTRMMAEISDNTAHVKAKTWAPRVLKTTATRGDGVADLYRAIEDHVLFLSQNPSVAHEKLRAAVESEMRFLIAPVIENATKALSVSDYQNLEEGRLSPIAIANQYLDKLLKPEAKI